MLHAHLLDLKQQMLAAFVGVQLIVQVVQLPPVVQPHEGAEDSSHEVGQVPLDALVMK